jgi:hypothetical protein
MPAADFVDRGLLRTCSELSRHLACCAASLMPTANKASAVCCHGACSASSLAAIFVPLYCSALSLAGNAHK